MKIHLFPIFLGLSWMTLIWLWLFHILPITLETIVAFIVFFIGSIVTEAVGESNDEKQDIRIRKFIESENTRNLRRN